MRVGINHTDFTDTDSKFDKGDNDKGDKNNTHSG